MKQFTEEELIELKHNVAYRMDYKDSYEDLIHVYYTSFEVLRFLNSLDEDAVSQIDLRFWTYAGLYAISRAQKIEEEIAPLFAEFVEFDESVERAAHMHYHPYGRKESEDKYFAMLKEQAQRREYYQTLHRLAGIYVDIYSEKIGGEDEEHYFLWLGLYNRLSLRLELPERGFGEDDEARLSDEEIEYFLCNLKAARNAETSQERILTYWNPKIERFAKMLFSRKND